MMSGRFEYLLSGSREAGLDAWDLATGASLWSTQDVKLSAAAAATVHTHTAQGRHQVITTDAKRPYLHTVTFSLSHSSTSATRSSLSSSLPASFSAIAVSPSSLYLLAASSSSPTLFLFSSRSCALLTSFTAHYKPAACLAWTGNGRFVISGGEDGCVNVFALTDLLRDEEEERQLRRYVAASAFAAVASSSSSSSASSSLSSSAVRPHCAFSSHSLPVSGLHAPSSSFRSHLYSASLDHSVHVHSIVSRQTVQRFLFPAAITAVTVTAAASAVLAGGSNGIVYYQPIIASAASASPSSSSFTALPGHSLPISCLSLSFSSSLLASTARDGSLRIHDLQSLQCIRTISRTQRAGFDWCRFVTEGRAQPDADWSGGVKGSRRREAELRGSVSISREEAQEQQEEEQREERQEMEDEWQELTAAAAEEGEAGRLLAALEAERRRGAERDAELAEWKAVNAEMYRICALQLLKNNAAATAGETEGRTEDAGQAGGDTQQDTERPPASAAEMAESDDDGSEDIQKQQP